MGISSIGIRSSRTASTRSRETRFALPVRIRDYDLVGDEGVLMDWVNKELKLSAVGGISGWNEEKHQVFRC